MQVSRVFKVFISIGLMALALSGCMQRRGPYANNRIRNSPTASLMRRRRCLLPPSSPGLMRWLMDRARMAKADPVSVMIPVAPPPVAILHRS